MALKEAVLSSILVGVLVFSLYPTQAQDFINQFSNVLNGATINKTSTDNTQNKTPINIIPKQYIKASNYGRIRLYLSSSPETGWDLNRLRQISEEWKTRIYAASDGMIDNIDFYYDPLNPNTSNPNINLDTMSQAFYFAWDCDAVHPPRKYFSVFSFAVSYGSPVYGVTCPMNDFINGNGNLWQSNLHEYGHTLGCLDGEGDIMRCIQGEPCDIQKYPPVCLDIIQSNIINHKIKLY